MRKKLLLLIATLLMVTASGCSHNMHIDNLGDYFTPPSPPRSTPLKIGVKSLDSADMQKGRYLEAIVGGLQRTGNFEKVIYPYSEAVHKNGVDFVADISVSPRYDGSGVNFVINWPGFLIFAPAIWGYKYSADIETSIALTRLTDKQSKELAIPTRYVFRHAAMNRTWTEVGWLEVGIIPLIGGFVFMGYDENVTYEFTEKVSQNYGSYVAKKIIDAL